MLISHHRALDQSLLQAFPYVNSFECKTCPIVVVELVSALVVGELFPRLRDVPFGRDDLSGGPERHGQGNGAFRAGNLKIKDFFLEMRWVESFDCMETSIF